MSTTQQENPASAQTFKKYRKEYEEIANQAVMLLHQVTELNFSVKELDLSMGNRIRSRLQDIHTQSLTLSNKKTEVEEGLIGLIQQTSLGTFKAVNATLFLAKMLPIVVAAVGAVIWLVLGYDVSVKVMFILGIAMIVTILVGLGYCSALICNYLVYIQDLLMMQKTSFTLIKIISDAYMLYDIQLHILEGHHDKKS